MCEGLIILIFGLYISIGVIPARSAAVSNLTCYDCSDSFKYFWNPYTPCQKNLSAVTLRQCHSKHRYCKVERISLKSITLSIQRSCVSDCYYGCKVYGFGITQLRCTSCCQGYACNTDNGSTNTLLSSVTQFSFLVPLIIYNLTS